jgi:hypothetical protein
MNNPILVLILGLGTLMTLRTKGPESQNAASVGSRN